MNSQEIEAREANTIDDVVQQIMAIDGPCSCESQLCLHWRTEAGIILAGFLSDRDFDVAEYRRGVSDERERIKVATEAILLSEEEREENDYNEAWNDALGEVLWKILPKVEPIVDTPA